MGVVIYMTMVVALVLAWKAGRARGAVTFRRASTVPAIPEVAAIPEATGVPEAPLDDGDYDVHKVEGPHVYSTRALRVRMPSSQALIVPDRLARGSVPPPFATTSAGEFVIRPAPVTPSTGVPAQGDENASGPSSSGTRTE